MYIIEEPEQRPIGPMFKNNHKKIENIYEKQISKNETSKNKNRKGEGPLEAYSL